MKKFSKNSIVTLVVSILVFTFGFTVPLTTYAATTPSLGTANTFGLLSNLFQHNATTTITGVVGNTLGVLGHSSKAGAGIINVSNGIEEADASAAWTVAGIAQGVAWTNLNNQYLNSCTDISSLTPAALEGVVINGGAPGTFPPGCYWSSGPMGITASGIVTLSGAGTHLFRPGGALTTGANSQVNLTGAGASACDVFWIPIAATTLGANSIFTGTDIDASGITIGDTVAWSGRALAYGGTITSNGGIATVNTITVPTCTNPASLTVTKTVINDGGGTKVVADFPLSVDATLVTSGVLNNFQAGTYVITETTNSNYNQTFSGSCIGGNITIVSGQDYACTITNTYVPPPVSSSSSGGGTHYGCKDPNASNYEYFASSNPALCVYTNAVISPIVVATTTINTTVFVPKLPNTGFPPERKSILWDDIAILAGTLMLVSISLVMFFKKIKI